LITTFFTTMPAYVGESAAMYSEMLSKSCRARRDQSTR
jgi:hypothetical protein